MSLNVCSAAHRFFRSRCIFRFVRAHSYSLRAHCLRFPKRLAIYNYISIYLCVLSITFWFQMFFTMNKCISIHIWCSSKSVSECVRKIIIYHIILFSLLLFFWCFVVIYLYSLGFLICFYFSSCAVCSLLVAYSRPSKESHRENFKLSFEWSSSGETRYGKIMSSLNDTHTKSMASARFSFYLFFIVSLSLALACLSFSQSKLQRILFVYINQLLVKQVYFAFKM